MDDVNLDIYATKGKWRTADGWPGLGRKLRVLVAAANKGGCSYYRAWCPFEKLEELYPNVIECRYTQNPLGIDLEKQTEDEEKEDMKWCDVFFTQNLHNFGGPATVRALGVAREMGKYVWYDTDDLLTDIYDDHRLKATYTQHQLEDLTKHLYFSSDLVTVTQVKFAERIMPYCDGTLAVIKNAIDYNLPCWNQPKIEARKGLTRVGWVGGIHHEADVKEFTSVPKFVNQRIGAQKVFWGFYGRPPVDPNGKDNWQQDVWDNYEKTLLKGMKDKNYQIYGALPSSDYGVFYTNIDLSIAPLQNNAFNDSKSDIKVAECGRYGVPLIASNIGCYADTIVNGETGFLLPPDATQSDWTKVLSKVLKDPKWVREMGENLKTVTDELFDINNVVHQRLDVLEYSMQAWLQEYVKHDSTTQQEV